MLLSKLSINIGLLKAIFCLLFLSPSLILEVSEERKALSFSCKEGRQNSENSEEVDAPSSEIEERYEGILDLIDLSYDYGQELSREYDYQLECPHCGAILRIPASFTYKDMYDYICPVCNRYFTFRYQQKLRR